MKGKKLLIIGAAFALGLSACAGATRITRANPLKAIDNPDDSITFSDKYSSNTTLDGTAITVGSSTVTFNKASGSTAPQYYTSGKAVRLYAKGTLVVASASKTITAIDLIFGESDGTNAFTVSPGTWSSPSWTGSASSVTFTEGGSSGNRRIAGINIKYLSSGDAVPATAISLDSTALNLKTGDEEALTATLTPSNSTDVVSWLSSNEDVATVDEGGKVYAKAAGNATITAFVDKNDNGQLDSGDLSATRNVAVTYEHGTAQSDPLTVAEAIAIGSPLAHQQETKKYFIQGTVSQIVENSLNQSYNNATFWLSNGDEPQGFEAYRVKPISTCTNYDDLKAGAVVLLECNIKHFYETIETGTTASLLSIVYNAPALTSISLSGLDNPIEKGCYGVLKAAPVPADAPLGTVVWTSSNENFATVSSSGLVTGVAVGSATITAFADANDNGELDEGEISASKNITVNAASSNSLKATLRYTDSTTTNMAESGNAALVNLGETIFLVDAGKGEASNLPGLNKDGSIRLYSKKASNATGHGSYFTVSIASAFESTCLIKSIKVNFSHLGVYGAVYAGDTLVEGVEDYYEINASSFKVENAYKSNGSANEQVYVSSIEIFYQGPGAEEEIRNLATKASLSYDYTKSGDGAADLIDLAFTGVTTTTYADWDNESSSGISYLGSSALSGTSFVLRDNNNSGVAVSGNTNELDAKRVTIKWGVGVSADRYLDVYGKNEAYSLEDLYGSNDDKGELLGSFSSNDKDTISIDITESYKYIAFRSRSNSVILASVEVVWGDVSYSYTNVAIRFSGLISVETWNRLDTESHYIKGYGVMLTLADNLGDDTLEDWYGAAKTDSNTVLEAFEEACDDTGVKYFDKALSNGAHPDEANEAQTGGAEGDHYVWNLYKKISLSKLTTDYKAVAYIRLENEVIFLNETVVSVKGLAHDAIKNNLYESSFGGSLSDLANK